MTSSVLKNGCIELTRQPVIIIPESMTISTNAFFIFFMTLSVLFVQMSVLLCIRSTFFDEAGWFIDETKNNDHSRAIDSTSLAATVPDYELIEIDFQNIWFKNLTDI